MVHNVMTSGFPINAYGATVVTAQWTHVAMMPTSVGKAALTG